jgi:hypothetical protein
VDPRAGLDAVKRKKSLFLMDMETVIVHPIA